MMRSVNISLESLGILITIILLACCVTEKKEDKQQSYLILLLILNAAVLLCDLLTWVFEYHAEYTILLYVLNFLVYSLGYVMVAVFTAYLASYLSFSSWISHKINKLAVILCMTAVILVVVSLYNHMYFSFDQGIYERGSLYWFSQLYPVLMIVGNMIAIVRHRKQLGGHDTLALLSYGVLPVIAMSVQIFLYGVTLLYLSSTLSLLIIFIMIHSDQGRRKKEQEMQEAEQVKNIMLSQIQPHFLYNALNTIQMLCEIDAKLAAKTVENFARYLRGNMEALGMKSTIPFEMELEHVRQYVAIEQLRFEDISIQYQLDAYGFMLPALTIQPLVENAIRYGVRGREKGGTVILASREDDQNWYVEIKDNGIGYCPEEVQYDGRSSIGINRIKERLHTMCHGTLDVQSVRGEGTTVRIRIPKEG